MHTSETLQVVIALGFVLISTLLSITLHEAMHAFMSHWLGDDTAEKHGRLTFNPLRHIDPVMTVLVPLLLTIAHLPPFGAAKPVPFNPNRVKWGDYGAALVGLAGPMTNFVLGFIGVALFALFPNTDYLSSFFQIFAIVNVSFFVFNMLPLPPLDGSRVLYAFAPESARVVMEQLERYGVVVVFAVVLIFSSQLNVFMVTAVNAILTLFSLPFGLTVGV